jgi:hypothetical protein
LTVHPNFIRTRISAPVNCGLAVNPPAGGVFSKSNLISIQFFDCIANDDTILMGLSRFREGSYAGLAAANSMNSASPTAKLPARPRCFVPLMATMAVTYASYRGVACIVEKARQTPCSSPVMGIN